MPDDEDFDTSDAFDAEEYDDQISNLAKVPDFISPALFKSVIAAAVLIWRSQGVRPTHSLIHGILSSQPIELLQRITLTREFATEMYRNGVLWDPERDVLSTRQLLALNEISNPLSGRSLTARLKAAGVSHKEFLSWKKNPVFLAKYAQLTNDLLEQSRPELLVSLLQLGLDGKLDAIKYIDEITGTLSGSSSNQKLLDLRQFAQTLLEIVQEEVRDPAILQRIATRMQLASASFNPAPTLNTRQQLTEVLR